MGKCERNIRGSVNEAFDWAYTFKKHKHIYSPAAPASVSGSYEYNCGRPITFALHAVKFDTRQHVTRWAASSNDG